jgi:hypothetical protein
MGTASLTPSISSQAIKLIFALVLKARHTRGMPSLTTIRSILRLFPPHPHPLSQRGRGMMRGSLSQAKHLYQKGE